MKIISNYNITYPKYRNIKAFTGYQTNMYQLEKEDTVSFTGRKDKDNNHYKQLSYLKDEEVISQDDFSTTIVDKNAKRSFMDKIRNRKISTTIYDLPLRLHEDLEAQGKETIPANLPPEILDATGLTEKEFENKIEDINALINLVRPKYDLYEYETKQSFQVKMGDKVADVDRITQGLTGSVYKISIPDCKPLALKSYFNHKEINLREGAFPEIAIAQKMNQDKVSSVADLRMANPYNGWMLSDFVTPDYKSSLDGDDIMPYSTNNSLRFDDLNPGTFVKGKNRGYLVDFGYISKDNSDTGYLFNTINEVVNHSQINKYNNPNNYTEDSLPLHKILMSAMYTDMNTKDKIVTKYEGTPEFRIFNNIITAEQLFVMRDKEIPAPLSEQLQKDYEALGFVGDATKLVKSCNQ